ncbi:aspartic peptidase domain-containing protein [Pisolithus microcarpus]|nr:aspartic peptidase domain-containing protein [Pisolithus microcarpus]
MPNVPDARPTVRRSRGNARERPPIAPRNEGTGGSSGIVLSMDMVWTSYYAVAYTVPVQIGTSLQNFSLQVDTGSSDLWVASKSCSTSSCSSTSGRLYDPSSSSTSTGKDFSIQYLQGSVSGPIVWDAVQIGGYSITSQALGAATSVNDEPLSYEFDGILGLSLPLNSVIQQQIPAQIGDSPDGAALSSNLLSITPTNAAPSQPFFSLSLARPGSNQIPSLLGIGLHPSQIISDPAQIRYSQLVSQSMGELYWKTNIMAITVYVNGQALPVTLQSLSGAVQPTAVLDSGMPVILTTSTIANGIYGALGISPGSDGQYYVPCTTPLNMTITLQNQPELPIHPLDLTVEPSGQSNAQYCVGLIQSADTQLQENTAIGDMVLGVPFMRNVYTVMAYEMPTSKGTFNTSVSTGLASTLGLLGLTNATQAMEEFHTVRVLNQPLDGGQSPSSSTSQNGLSVGVEVLLGLIGFFALCFVSFGLRWFFARRKWRKQAENASSPTSSHSEQEPDDKFEYTTYELMRRDSQSSSVEEVVVPPDTLRALALEPAHGDRIVSQCTVDSGRTYVEETGNGLEEFGLKDHKTKVTSMGSGTAPSTWRDTLVGSEGEGTPTSPMFPSRHRTTSELVSVPLLAHHQSHHRRSESDGSDSGEFAVSSFGNGGSMAGVGTAVRGSQIDPDLGGMMHARMRSFSSGMSGLSTVPLRLPPGPRSSMNSLSSRRGVIGPREPRPRSMVSRTATAAHTLERPCPSEGDRGGEWPESSPEQDAQLPLS